MFSIYVADRKASQQSRFILKHVNKKKNQNCLQSISNSFGLGEQYNYCVHNPTLLACINLYRAFVQI